MPRVPKRRRPITSARSESAIALATYLSLFAGLIPAVVGVVESLASKRWANALSWTFLLVVVGVALYRLLFRHVPPEVRPTKEFQPFSELTIESAWPREPDVASIVDAINRVDGKVPLVVGESGVGKSVLLSVLVRDAMHRQYDYHHIESYGNIRSELDRLLKPREGKRPVVVVLDQFEQWLASARELREHRRDEAHRWLEGWLRQCASDPTKRVVLSVRLEWYFELRFLGDLVPAPVECCNIISPRIGDTGGDIEEAIFRGFYNALRDPDEADAIVRRLSEERHPLPLEIQMVGAVIERRREVGKPVTAEKFDSELRGVAGAVDEYLMGIVDGASNRRICMKVLCALSAKTRFRTQADLSDILTRLFEDEEEVLETVDYLVGQNLVLKRGVGTYELGHDYLAAFFNAKSGSELDPYDRDNILCHLDAAGAINDDALKVATGREARGLRLGRAVVVPLIVLMTVRLFGFGIHWTLLGHLQPQYLLHGQLLDAAYVPIFVAHGVWITYIAFLHDRLLIRLRESPAARAFSVFIVLDLIAAVGLGLFIPYTWLVVIGWQGMWLGLKLMSIGKRSDLSGPARERLWVYGSTTLFNLVFLTGMGAVFCYASFRLVKNQADMHTWILVSLFLSAMMTYACAVLARLHVSRPAMSQLLGLVGRPRELALPRTT